jgi:hypothetical protein
MMLGRRHVSAYAECEQKQQQGQLLLTHCSVCTEGTAADGELRLLGIHILKSFRTSMVPLQITVTHV